MPKSIDITAIPESTLIMGSAVTNNPIIDITTNRSPTLINSFEEYFCVKSHVS